MKLKRLCWLFIIAGFVIPLVARVLSPIEVPPGLYIWIWLGGGLSGAGSFWLMMKLVEKIK